MCTPIVAHTYLEELFTCPYEPAHRIMRKKMLTHLVKCRKNNPCSDMTRCSYNAGHIVPSVELAYHEETCDDRIKGDRERYRFEAEPSELFASPELVPLNAIPSLEEFDDDWSMSRRPVPVQSVNANLQEQLKERKVMIPKQGATKSERKAHYMEERRRHNIFDEQQPSTSAAYQNNPPVPAYQNPSDLSQPLRKPRNATLPPQPAQNPVKVEKQKPTRLPRSASKEPAKKQEAPKEEKPVAGNENEKPPKVFPKGRGKTLPGTAPDPRIGSGEPRILSESRPNNIVDSIQRIRIDSDGFFDVPIPNKGGKGRGLPKNV